MVRAVQRLFLFIFLSLRVAYCRCWAKTVGQSGMLLVLLMLVLLPAQSAETQPVRLLFVPALHGYDVKLLQRALHLTQQQYGPATVIQEPYPERPSTRAEIPLINKNIDIGVFTCRLWRNEALYRIPFSLLQGMNGYRLLLVSSESSNKISATTSLTDLQQHLIGGVVFYWEDFRIYNHNKLLSSTSPDLQNIYDKLFRGDIDYFSRGVHEVFREQERLKSSHPELSISSHVALYYPLDFYFYSRSADTELTKRITEGLAKAEKDGSMKQLFQQSFAEQIRKLKEINPKRLIYLSSPEKIPNEHYHFDWWLPGEPPTAE